MEGKTEGETNGMAKAVRALMASMKMSAKEAMDKLAIPDEMRNSVRMLI